MMFIKMLLSFDTSQRAPRLGQAAWLGILSGGGAVRGSSQFWCLTPFTHVSGAACFFGTII